MLLIYETQLINIHLRQPKDLKGQGNNFLFYRY